MIKYSTDCTQLTVHPSDQHLFSSDQAIFITVDVNANGCFVEVSRSNDDRDAKLGFSPVEWPSVRAAIDAMMEVALKDAQEQ